MRNNEPEAGWEMHAAALLLAGALTMMVYGFGAAGLLIVIFGLANME